VKKIFAALLLAGCGIFGAAQSVVSTGQRVHTVVKTVESIKDVMKPEQEYYLGRSVATNILAKHDYKYRDAADLKAGRLVGLTQYVNEVGTYLATTSMELPPESGDRPPPIAGWHFVVLESDTVNAFAAPGGFIFVTTAALRLAENEDQLAAILAHEISHVRRGHALGSIKKSRYADIGVDVFEQTASLSPEQIGQLTKLMDGAIDDLIHAYFEKGYSRETEFEADAVGLRIMANAGYDPHAFVDFLKQLEAHQDTGKGGFYATHPSADSRIAKLDDLLKTVTGGKAERARVTRFLSATKELR
jgi:predicted Zn-dependent protease